jgi:2-isopropylmalate synthase
LADSIFDWNAADGTFDWSSLEGLEVNDETFRDGGQNPSVVDPPLGDKIRLLHLMEALGIHAVDLGLPGAGARPRNDVEALAREIGTSGLRIRPNCAARTLEADIRPIAEIAQRAGIPLEVAMFIGVSPLRQKAEGWGLDEILRRTEESVAFAVSEGLPVMFVTEDSSRSRPEDLKAVYRSAVEAGAGRICLADTVGHAIPDGVEILVRFVREEVLGPDASRIPVDWHGHQDRGLGLACALTAARAGARRIHATALGIGERVGNVPMDLLLVNLKLLGVHRVPLDLLPAYGALAAAAWRVSIPHNYPVLGRDAFRTGTGVHASAILKAERMGDDWLKDRIYSGVPAAMVGREQEIEVSPYSGLSNVKHWLSSHGFDSEDGGLARRILDAAKTSNHTLSAAEIMALMKAP